MTSYTLTKTQLIGGIWQGILTGADDAMPTLVVTHEGQQLDGIQLVRDAPNSRWYVTFQIPVALISDGIQTFVISDEKGHTLSSFALLSGEALAEDIRAEVDLLRSELDLLKQAFRKQFHDTQT